MAKKNILLRSKMKKARALVAENRLEEAEKALRQLVRLAPMDAEVWLGLGFIAGKQGAHADAVECFAKAVAIRPDDARARYNLGIALRDSGRVEDAIAAFGHAVRLDPANAEALNCLAAAHTQLGQMEQAAEGFRRSLAIDRSNAETHSNLGCVYQAQGLLGEAEACYRKAISLQPDLAIADNLGSVLSSRGQFEDALEVYSKGLARQPGNARLLSNLLLTLNYVPDYDREQMFREHKRFNALFAGKRPLLDSSFSAGERHRLRIGYVSPDFREHSVAYFIVPVLEGHDRSRFEVFGYSSVPRPDAVTLGIQAACDHWRDISVMTSEQVAAQVRADRIDILVDLAGHTAGNCLTVFARKPAPVQVTYLGYPNTTGLESMDYRIVDPVTDAPDQDQYYTEKLVRLPGCFLCYKPPVNAPAVSALPALAAGHLTFGSFNNLSKINDDVIRLWSDVVKGVPGSRLLVKNSSLTDEQTRSLYRKKFLAQGLDHNDIELMGHTPTREEHLELYSRVDIALDTVPYNGTTTTCEALWLGVPVLTLRGTSHAACVGASLLQAAGLHDWISDSEASLVSDAINKAENLDSLSSIRANLRKQLLVSDLCNTHAFIARLEGAYNQMWQQQMAGTLPRES